MWGSVAYSLVPFAKFHPNPQPSQTTIFVSVDFRLHDSPIQSHQHDSDARNVFPPSLHTCPGFCGQKRSFKTGLEAEDAKLPETRLPPKPRPQGHLLSEVYTPGRTAIAKHDPYQHENLLPKFLDLHWEPLQEVTYQDKGLQGHPNFHNLLAKASDVFDYNPKIGTEITGVHLAHLSDDQKNDLAQLIATRGIVFFRNQDDFDIQAQRELGKYFGTLHKVQDLHTHGTAIND